MRSLALAILLFIPSLLLAELPSPRLDRLVPLGAAAGSSVEVEVTGPDLDGSPPRMLFDHPGITASHLKDRKFAVTVAASVPAGTYDARIVGRHGISSPRLFAISNGIAELAEKEPNEETPQEVPVNSIVNGTSDGNKDDSFRLVLKAGQRVVIDCAAQKLDSQLDATLTLTDASGKPLASNGDTNGRDPQLDFVAPADGEYIVRLADLTYRGGLPYRLLITDRPQVENVFPRAVQAGKPTELTVLGRNLRPGPMPAGSSLNPPLDTITTTVTAPADLLALGSYRFVEHPTDHTVLPTAATCTLTGFQFAPIIDGKPANPMPLLVTDSPVSLEVEPNDEAAKPQKLSLPAVVSGRFDRDRDADWYEITTGEKDGGPYFFDVYCERIAGRADPYLVVLDEKGNRVTELDDFGIRTNAFDGHIRDVSGSVNLSPKQTYRILVQDRYRRGGPRYQYVLCVRRPTPDFYPAVIHSSNPNPGGTTLRRGGAEYLDVIVHYTDGFRGPITITAEGLPKGVHTLPSTSNDNRATVTLWADADAPEWVGPIRLIATAKTDDGRELRREVRPYTRVWGQGDGSSRPTRELVVAVLAEPAPFALRFDSDRVEIEAGKKLELPLRCDRPLKEFTGPVTVIPLSFPNTVKMSQITVPAGKTEAKVTFDIPANAREGEYTFSVQGQGQVPIETKDGKKQNTLVSLPSRPITIVVKAAPKK